MKRDVEVVSCEMRNVLFTKYLICIALYFMRIIIISSSFKYSL